MQPETGMLGQPIWHHHHSHKMALDKRFNPRDRLVISGSAARIAIWPGGAIDGEPYWLVQWRIQFSAVENIYGQVAMTSPLIATAFGLSDQTPEPYDQLSQWILDRYGADVAAQGKFIRWRQYLNIPGPGTSHDGDPNVSILLDGEMREAVRTLINATALVSG